MSWKRLIALFAVLALLAGACGDDDDNATGGDTTADDDGGDAGGDSGDDADSDNEGADDSDAPEGTVAGSGGELLLLQWQAPSQANPLLSGGTKDLLAGSLVLEPLAEVGPDGALVPALAAEIPTVSNGGLSADGLSITWKLRDDVLWSDGTPFTSADVVFTYEYCADEATGCSSDTILEISSVVADDDHTVTVSFADPLPYPYKFGVGYTSPMIQKAQMEPCIGAAATGCADQNFSPVGTGPYVVTELRPEDTVTYAMNETTAALPTASPSSALSPSRVAATLSRLLVQCLRSTKPTTPGTSRWHRRFLLRWKPPALVVSPLVSLPTLSTST